MTDQELLGMPGPLVADCVDLRDFQFIPIHVSQLLDSETWLTANGAEAKAAITLWCKSWHQVPAASLPNDDKLLAIMSGAGAKWPKVKAVALRNFVECSDGRLYHRVLAEIAMEAWGRRKTASSKGKAGAAKRWHSTSNASANAPAIAQAMPAPMPGDSKGQGQGQGQGQRKKDAADAASEGFTNGHHPDLSDQKTQLFARGREVLGDNAGGLVAQLLKAKGGNVAKARGALEAASVCGGDPREYVGSIVRNKPPPSALPYDVAL